MLLPAFDNRQHVHSVSFILFTLFALYEQIMLLSFLCLALYKVQILAERQGCITPTPSLRGHPCFVGTPCLTGTASGSPPAALLGIL